MAGTRKKFSPQFREEAVKMVIDGSRPIADCRGRQGTRPGGGGAGELSGNLPAAHAGDERPLSTNERTRLCQLDTFTSVKDLETAVALYINGWNDRAHPFT